jgi:zinc transporter ZupT
VPVWLEAELWDCWRPRHRKRSGEQQLSEAEDSGSGAAIAIGALLDGVPESVVLGLSLLSGSVGTAVLVAIFISSLPEGLSSAPPPCAVLCRSARERAA